MDNSSVSEALDRGNPVVFLEMTAGGARIGTIYLELFKSLCPRATENFRALACGELRAGGAPLGYKGCKFHRVLKGFMIQGGDFVKGDGTGRACAFGGSDRFADEPEGLRARHAGPGVLSMANSGPNTNGCQFFITTAKAEWLDGKHVVFGRVLDPASMLVVRKIENLPVSGASGKPTIDVVVAECGEM